LAVESGKDAVAAVHGGSLFFLGAGGDEDASGGSGFFFAEDGSHIQRPREQQADEGVVRMAAGESEERAAGFEFGEFAQAVVDWAFGRDFVHAVAMGDGGDGFAGFAIEGFEGVWFGELGCGGKFGGGEEEAARCGKVTVAAGMLEFFVYRGHFAEGGHGCGEEGDAVLGAFAAAVSMDAVAMAAEVERDRDVVEVGVHGDQFHAASEVEGEHMA